MVRGTSNKLGGHVRKRVKMREAKQALLRMRQEKRRKRELEKEVGNRWELGGRKGWREGEGENEGNSPHSLFHMCPRISLTSSSPHFPPLFPLIFSTFQAKEKVVLSDKIAKEGREEQERGDRGGGGVGGRGRMVSNKWFTDENKSWLKPSRKSQLLTKKKKKKKVIFDGDSHRSNEEMGEHCKHTHTQTHKYTHTHTYKHTHAQTHTHTNTHTHTHTHTHNTHTEAHRHMHTAQTRCKLGLS